MNFALNDSAAPKTPIPEEIQVAGLYFDGVTSRAHPVVLSAAAGMARLRGDISLQCPLAALKVSQRVRNGVRRISFADGAVLETTDLAGLEALLTATGFQDGIVIRAQHSWRAVLVALVLTVLTLGAGYRFGIPAAARLIAFALPASVERSVGTDAMAFLDKVAFAATTLASAQREAIIRRFALVTAYDRNAPTYRIVFRKSRIGPNAFALPSGDIVLTDEIVRLQDNDDAIIGILGHELGHLRQRHMMRRLIQGSVSAAVATLLVGEVSAIAVNLPTVLVDLAYSRDAEREADDEAVALLKANGISREPFAQLFETLAKKDGGAPSSAYLSSHPAPAERIERIRSGR